MRIDRRMLVVCATALLLVSCGSSGASGSPPATSTGTQTKQGTTTYIGKIEGTDLSAAALVDNGRLLLYVCDGVNGRRFEGTLGATGYSAAVDGAGTLTVALTGNTVTGALAAGGTSYPLRAEVATGKAGLLWATGDKAGVKVSAGWIVSADGSETGGVVAGITDGTSNLTIKSSGLLHTQQDGIIAVLIGLRANLNLVP